MSEAAGIGTTKSMYLLDGRRVTIQNLIDENLLAVGETLRFVRPRRDETHFAKVTEAGGLVLEDGQEFSSPSPAAKAAAGIESIDGWHAWMVLSTGDSLDTLRGRLLDRVAAQSEDSGREQEPDLQHRHNFLKDARERADSDAPLEISVLDLLAHWNAKSRGQRISHRIEADLANHGLVTSPSFRKVAFDSRVELINASTQEVRRFEIESPDVDDSEELDFGLTIGNLPSALGGLVSVTPNATFEEVITLMLLNDFSQLAVLSGRHNLRGAITWKSIAQARHATPDARLSDAIIHATAVAYHQELIDTLAILQAEDFVFVRNDKNAVAGIVTTSDVVQAYGELATPFFLIGELDQLLRLIVSRSFTLDEVTALCDPESTRTLESFEHLAMGDYQQVLGNPNKWEKLRWPLHRATFVSHLDELRKLRNDIMHFNPDPIPLDTVDKLRNFLGILRKYGV